MFSSGRFENTACKFILEIEFIKSYNLEMKNKIYLDYAASTPVAPEVSRAMEPYFSEKFGNPGSLHFFGQEAINAVDRSRKSIAESIGAKFEEIIFTGSATEANNLALRGVLRRFLIQDSRIKNPRVVVSAIEHESVLETARDLEKSGIEVIYLPVDGRGIIDLASLKKSVNEVTVLVSVMYANNEIGSVQPIAEAAKIINNFRPKKTGERSDRQAFPLFHTDAAQAFQFLDCNIQNLGVDMMTLSSHKIYGPKGIGALCVRNKTRGLKIENGQSNFLSPLVTGGGQEFGMRSGTENVPSIVGFAEAIVLAAAAREKETKRIGELRDYFWSELKKIAPDSELNGDTYNSLPNILNVYFPEQEAQFLLTRLDLAGVAAASGSACRSRAMESSYVIEALGFSAARAKRSIRFSLGRQTTKKDIEKTTAILKECL